MKFWPIRTLEELEILLSGQPLRTDPDEVDKDRKEAYQWISKQLSKKVTPPQGVEYPNIFSIENLLEDWTVQGITWEILPEYMVNYKIFTGR